MSVYARHQFEVGESIIYSVAGNIRDVGSYLPQLMSLSVHKRTPYDLALYTSYIIYSPSPFHNFLGLFECIK